MLRMALLPLLVISLSSACDNSPSGGADDGLPPDPGEQGRATVPGVDSDNDGLRDDVQRYIYQTYTDEATRNALVQAAKPHLESLEVFHDEAAILQLTDKMARGVECVYSVRGAANARRDLGELEAVMLNTRARIEAARAADAQAGGATFALSGDPAAACEQ